MALLTAKGISRLAIELLVRRLVLPRTVARVPGTEFVGPNGGTITVRVPQPTASRKQASRGDALVPSDIDEIPVDVTLAHIYHLKNVTDQEMTLDIENFGRQITLPQVESVAAGAEDELSDVMNAQTADGDLEFAETPSNSNTEDVILGARERLGNNDVPPDGRFCAVSSDIATRVLKLLTNRETPDTDGALRDAIIGRLYGFTFVESSALDPGTASFYHRSGYVMATRPLANPRGATEAATVTATGITLRQIFQYATSHAQDQSLVSVMAGAAVVNEGTDQSQDLIIKRSIKVGTAGVS